MNQSGDAHAGQPGESVDSLSDIAAMIDGDGTPEQEETLPDIDGEESEEGEEEAEAEGEAEGEEGEEETDQYEFTIKVDGKETAVKLNREELIESIQKSVDYTNKTMAVAEERKAVIAERQKAEANRTQYEQALQAQQANLSAFAEFAEAQVGQPPHISLAQHDPAAYLAEKELYEARKGQLAQVREAINRNREEQDRSRHTWIMEQAEITERSLRDTLPGWNDDTLNTLASYAQDLGLNPQTVDVAFVQKGFWEALHKARAYDELQARKATLKPKAELPKVTRPKATNQTPRGIVHQQAAEKAYRARPSLDTLADLID